MPNFLRRTAVRAASAGSLALAVTSLTACDLDKTLQISDVDVATPDAVANKAGLPAVYAGGRADFSNAFGNTDEAVTLPGLLTDELRDIDTFPTRIEVDQRNITPGGGLQTTNGTLATWYRDMHRARASLERGTAAFAQYDPTNVQRAELHALDGMTYVMFAEDFCNGIAYSHLVNGNPVFGAGKTTNESLDLGISQFDSALTIAKAATPEAYLAQIGKGRALLNQGKVAEAAAAVASVPVTYQYQVFFSENSTRENNGIFVNTGLVSKRFAVADRDGGNGLAFRTLGLNQDSLSRPGDIRVRYYRSGVGQDGSSTAYYTLKYPSRSAPIILADGIEAQLIVAENQLRLGDVTGYLKTLNDLRANATLLGRIPYTQAGQTGAVLSALTDPGTTASRVDQLFAERAFWMYLTGHRLGDLRRLIRQYGRPAESVFPTGAYTGAAGGTFGTDVNFPVPVDEQNNTAAPACTNRSA